MRLCVQDHQMHLIYSVGMSFGYGVNFPTSCKDKVLQAAEQGKAEFLRNTQSVNNDVQGGFENGRGRRLSMESHRQQKARIVFEKVLRYCNACVALALSLQLTCEELPLKTNTASRPSTIQRLLLLSKFHFLLSNMFECLITALVLYLFTA
jgi:hypothetical protein